MALLQNKSTLLIASLVMTMSLGMTACSSPQNPKPTEEIAADQGAIAKANNPAPAAKEPATPIEKLGATPATTATTTDSTATTPATDATTDKPAEAPKADTATAEKPAETAKASGDAGEKLYASVCKACHDTGLLNSPKLGDKAAWKDRIAQGKDTLYKHSIEGFQGKGGVMPPKGGSSAPDEEVKAAVDYMVSKAS